MKNVIVYSTANCSYCIRLKEFLKEKGIEFTNIDISSNPGKTEEMVKKSGQMGVPVLDIEGEIIAGFDKKKISRILGIV